MATVAFKSRAPAKLPAFLWAVIFILFPAPAVLGGAWWAWLLAVPCLGLSGVLLLSVVAPRMFLSGVRMVPGGFEFRAPLRKGRIVRYQDIEQIDAVVACDGDMGLTFVDLVVRSKGSTVLIQEEVLIESGLLAQFEALPAFCVFAYVQAKQYKPSGLKELFAKRFRVFNAT